MVLSLLGGAVNAVWGFVKSRGGMRASDEDRGLMIHEEDGGRGK